MTHVVTERCVDCRYTDCCAVCPADCFFEVQDPAMLVIDPVTCIDCSMCIPECPIYAIYPEAEVPAAYQEWTAKNAELAPKGKLVTEATEALPSAIPLEKIHEREKEKGLDVKDPSAVADEGGGDGGAAAPAAPAAPPVRMPTSGDGGDKSERVRIGHAPKREPLGVNPGGRLRVKHRQGVVVEMRKRRDDDFSDVLILLDGDTRPTWYLYSALLTFRDQGECEVLERGPSPGLLGKLFGV